MSNHIVGIIQARLGSSRLPNKIFKEVKGKPLLQHMIERLSASKWLKAIVIATTTNPADDEIELFARNHGYLYFRGSESDVLDRFYRAAVHYEVDIVVRFCSDCPLIDPIIVDRIIAEFMKYQETVSLVCNKMPFTFPDGFDVEICSMSTLETIWKNASLPKDREHVFPYLYKRPELFTIRNVEYEGPELFHTHRITLDYEEDFLCIEAIMEDLYDRNPLFGLQDILELTQRRPELLKINELHLPDDTVRLAIDPGHSPVHNKKANSWKVRV